MPTPPGAVPSLAAPPAWSASAACRSTDAVHFFAPLGEPREQRARREHAARALCRRCPVEDDCLQYALRVQEPYGIWAGAPSWSAAGCCASGICRWPSRRPEGPV